MSTFRNGLLELLVLKYDSFTVLTVTCYLVHKMVPLLPPGFSGGCFGFSMHKNFVFPKSAPTLATNEDGELSSYRKSHRVEIERTWSSLQRRKSTSGVQQTAEQRSLRQRTGSALRCAAAETSEKMQTEITLSPLPASLDCGEQEDPEGGERCSATSQTQSQEESPGLHKTCRSTGSAMPWRPTAML